MTLVLDASALADWLLTPRGRAVAEVFAGHDLLAPGVLVPELLHVLRGWVRRGELDAADAEVRMQWFLDLGVELVPMVPLIPAAWHLRDVCSGYDAMYVALAPAGCRLVTCDERFARAVPDVAFVP